jgi:hypothetical protein
MGMYCEVSIASQEDLGRFSGEGLYESDTLTVQSVSLEKAWHGLHYLLTGEVWEGEGELAFLLAGGEPVGEDDESPIRWFNPDETRDIHHALSGVTDEQLWSRFDPAKMEKLQIYPGIWDEDESDLKEEYVDYFHELKNLVAAAVQSGQGLLVSIG